MMHTTQSNHAARVSRLSKGVLLLACLALALAAAPARAQNRELLNRLVQSAGNSDAAARAFTQARSYIDDGKYAQAASTFDKFIAQYPSDKNVDAALYWLAYAYNKQENFQGAYDALARLLQHYPRSTWAGDAKALRVEVMSKLRPGAPVDVPEDANDDLKIIALRALCENDKATCSARISEVLSSNNSSRVKEAAIILLGRYGGTEAVPALIQLSRNEPNVKLRMRAIRALGDTNDERALDVLREIAMGPTYEDESPTDSAIHALAGHESPRAVQILGEVATSGKNPRARTHAIEIMSRRRGDNVVDELLRLYDAVPDIQTKKYVVAGLGNRKDPRAIAKLLEIARSAPDPGLRMTAIHAIPNRGEEQDLDVLISLYDSERNDEIKLTLLSALGRYQNQRAYQKLEQIVRSPAEPIERRKVAISMLGNCKDPQCRQFLEDVLK
jgi:HEAT repeat protein